MVPDDLVLGYSRGYVDRLAREFSEPSDWRRRRVHILGGSPPKQWDVIQQLPDRRSRTNRRLTSSALTRTACIVEHNLGNSGRLTVGMIAVATLTTSRSARRSAIASTVSRSSGSPTVFGPDHHLRRRAFVSSMRGRHRVISTVPPVLNAERTSGRHGAVPSLPSTILVISVGTAAMTVTSRIVIEITFRKSPVNRASPFHLHDAATGFFMPSREGEGFRESPPRW